MAEYIYPLTAFPNGEIDHSKFIEEVKASPIAEAPLSISNPEPGGSPDVKLVFGSTVNQADLDAVVATHVSASLFILTKQAKVKAIDDRTDQLIAQGFTYNSKQFSLSTVDQLKLLGVFVTRADSSFVYPVIWNNIDDTSVESLADAIEVKTFFFTAIETVRMHLDSGTVLKDQVRAATTVGAVNAIVDDR